MNRLGIISQYDLSKRKAKVIFPDLDDAVSAELPVVFTVFEYGGVDVMAIPKYAAGETVLVSFYGDSLSEGVIVGKIGGSV